MHTGVFPLHRESLVVRCIISHRLGPLSSLLSGTRPMPCYYVMARLGFLLWEVLVADGFTSVRYQVEPTLPSIYYPPLHSFVFLFPLPCYFSSRYLVSVPIVPNPFPLSQCHVTTFLISLYVPFHPLHRHRHHHPSPGTNSPCYIHFHFNSFHKSSLLSFCLHHLLLHIIPIQSSSHPHNHRNPQSSLAFAVILFPKTLFLPLLPFVSSRTYYNPPNSQYSLAQISTLYGYVLAGKTSVYFILFPSTPASHLYMLCLLVS